MYPASEEDRQVRRSRSRRLDADHGSAVVEFVFVGALLTVLMLSVLQLALALHVRNTLIDAAAEGARFAALADTELQDGEDRTRRLIAVAVGSSYAEAVSASVSDRDGASIVTILVRAPLPILGLIGAPGTLEVQGHAVLETLA